MRYIIIIAILIAIGALVFINLSDIRNNMQIGFKELPYDSYEDFCQRGIPNNGFLFINYWSDDEFIDIQCYTNEEKTPSFIESYLNKLDKMTKKLRQSYSVRVTIYKGTDLKVIEGRPVGDVEVVRDVIWPKEFGDY